MRKFLVLMFFAVALLAITASAFAQSGTASLTGRVTDATGSVLVGARVQAINTATNVSYPTTTNESGQYSLPSLSPGNYKIAVDKDKFTGQVRPGVELHVADRVSIDFALSIGSVEQAVTVEGGTPLVDTTSSSLGGVINAAQIEDLPLNGRNYISLTLMQPGVTLDANEQKNGIYAGSWFSSNGAPIRSNNFMIDGAIMQDQNAGSTADFAGRTLGLDGIQEFRVITNSLSAEYGLTMGSQTVMVSKSGTNNFHGTAFDYLRNSALDAANYFDKPVQANGFRRLPEFQRNNFGGSIGGPILKGKTFFFANYERVRERLGVTNILNVPSDNCHGPAGAVIWNGTGTQPAGSIGPCTQLGANPAGAGTNSVTISSVGANLLALYPMANLPNNQYTAPYSQPDSDQFGQARIDHTFSQNDTLFGRYTILDDHIVLSLPFSQYFTNPKATRHQYFTASEDHIFSPSMLNTARVSFSRTAADRFGTNTLTDPQYQFVAGSAYPGMGQLSVGGLTAIAPSANPKSLTAQNILTMSDDLSWSFGKHSLKFGGTANKYHIYGLNPTGAQGTIQFGGLATLLRGRPSSYSGVAPGSVLDRTYDFYILGFYAQDSWRVTRNFTLNYGLRYEPAPWYYDEAHGISSTLVDRLTDTTPTIGPLFSHNPTLKNFSPRLGFAWDVFGNQKTALRGGAAVLYDVGNLVDAFNITKSQPPFSTGVSVTSTTANPIVLTSLPLNFNGATASKDFWLFDYNMKQPRLYTWNLGIEQQLPWTTALTIAYAGSRGVHLIGNQEGNPNVPTFVPGLPGGVTWPATGVRENPAWGSMNLIAANKDSIWHALEVNATKRLSHGLEVQTSWTWGRSIDNAQGGRNDCTASSAVGSDPFDPRYDRGPSCFNATHTWVSNFLYNLPSPNFLRALTGGWGIMGIYSQHSGFPFNPWETTERARSGYFSGTATPPVDRPSWNPAFTGSVITGNPNRWFDPNAFILQPVGTLGTVGRNSLIGPAYHQLDFALQKDTKIPKLGESGSLEFRAEFFNILNHPNFAEPNSATFVGALTNSTEAPLSTAGQITSTVGTSRQIEFSLKLKF